VVVIVDAARPLDASQHAAWLDLLNAASVPWGLVALLSREEASGGVLLLRSLGTLGEHRFELSETYRSTRRTVDVDAAGNCRVPLWIGSDGEELPVNDAAGALFRPAPQIADSCRWSSRDLRCSSPRVLHVWPGFTVTPCWRGPVVGKVGDPHRSLAARAGAARQWDGCPLAGPVDDRPRTSSAVETCELTSQLAWVLGREAA
jgi:hypothetical protein